MVDKTQDSISGVNAGNSRAHVLVNKESPLRRLNFFDGKFLRAPDLILEQQALLNQIRLSNQAGGAGIVYGYDCTLEGSDSLAIGGGFAIDYRGRALLLHDQITVGISDLIELSRQTTINRRQQNKDNFSTELTKKSNNKADFDDCVVHVADTNITITNNTDLYLITLHHVETRCGEEDVYGKLCSEACTTSTNHSYIIEGVEVRATALELSVLLKQSSSVTLSQQHLRSQVAAAYYEQEQQLVASHISSEGLTSGTWCLGAQAQAGNGVAIAVLARNANTTVFLDAWTARRERMESPARHYWAGRMMMRPWSVFLAQVLQFQCQLHGCLTSRDPDAPCKRIADFDPCANTRQVAGKAAQGMRYLLDQMGEVAGRLVEFAGGGLFNSDIADSDISNNTALHRALNLTDDFSFTKELSAIEKNYQQLVDISRVSVPEQLLINCGIVELPSAGYLPVNISSAVSVNEQVSRLLGAGVDLRFCVVQPDFVTHALEEAQHMDRVCLLSGIDDASKKQPLDILVPCGEIQQVDQQLRGTGYETTLAINSNVFAIGWPRSNELNRSDLQDNNGLIGIRSLAAELETKYSYSDAFRLVNTTATDLPSVTGASRSEQLDSGGYSFYCAAKSGQLSILQQAASSILAQANQMPQSILSLLGGGQSDLTLADGGDNSIEEIVADTTDDVSRRLTSGLRINTNRTSGRLSTGAQLSTSSALWLDMKTDRDPFTVNSGELVEVRAKIIMVITRTISGTPRTLIEQRQITGQLHIQKSAPQAKDTRLTARLIADGIWTKTTRGGGLDNDRTEQVSLDEQVVLRRSSVAGLPPSISVAVIKPSFFAGLGNVQLVFERHWVSAVESRVRMVLRYQNKLQGSHLTTLPGNDSVEDNANAILSLRRQAVSNTSDAVLVEGVFKENNEVLQPGNHFHSASLSALDVIGKITNNRGFFDQAGTLLFSVPEQVNDQLRILAKKSWVLFHRRRDKLCEAAVAKEPVVQPRLYRVYHINLPAEINIDELVTALSEQTSQTIARFRTRAVTTVEYSPGLATVTSHHEDVRDDWQAAVRVNADVHIGLIASQGEALDDGEVLADARLHSLTDLLAPVSEPADTLALLSSNEVPVTLAAGEVDGVVVYFTKAVATLCHTVYRLQAANAQEFDARLAKYLEQGNEPLTAFMQRFNAQVLSSAPRFINGSDDFYGANEAQQLNASWDLVGGGPISQLVTLANAETQQQQQVSQAQATKIARAIASFDQQQVSYFNGPANIFSTCSKATVLVTQTECHDVYIYRTFNQETDQLLKGMEALITNNGLTSQMLNNGTSNTDVRTNFFNPLATVDFYQNSSDFVSQSRQALVLDWQTALSGKPASSIKALLVTVARPADTDEQALANREFAKAQSDRLQEVLGVDTVATLVATNNVQVEFPVACRALTIVVMPQKVITDGSLAASNVAVALAVDPIDPVVEKPALTLESAEGFSFDANDEVVFDSRLSTAIERMIVAEKQIENLEVISIDNSEDIAAEKRAASLLKVLKEKGVATQTATVIIREADEAEKIEIVRSGFVLNRGFVLK